MGSQRQFHSKTFIRPTSALPVQKSSLAPRSFGNRPHTNTPTSVEDTLQTQLDPLRRPSNLHRVTPDIPKAAIQPKLTVGAPNDQYEQEADRVADQVMSMPDRATQNPVQREAAPEEDELQAKPISASITPLIQREAMPEEEEVQAKAVDYSSIQREAMPEEEEVQTKAIAPIQREEMPEEEEVQTKSLGTVQREEMPEEEEVQTKLLPTGTLQREEMPEEEEVQTKPLTDTLQREEMPEEEEVQTKPLANTLQRQEMPEEEEAVQTKPSLQRANDGSLQAGGNLESRLNSSKGGGSPLPQDVKGFMESRFRTDFSQVRVHTDSKALQMNRELNAQAFTHKQDVYFGAGKAPGKDALTAHELTHVVQQTGTTIGSTQREVLQRKIEMRDVGRGEQSGFARLPELVERLNAISRGLTFSMAGQELVYAQREGGTLSNFDQQMMTFIDQNAVIPLRLTNRHGLLGNRASGFHDHVEADAWSSGYVDIDDLLASDNLGLQVVLVHFLRERAATSNYARRIGSSSLDTRQPGPGREFDRTHGLGIEAEVQLLRDFFNDPTIRFIFEPTSGQVFRVYRNSRRDAIHTRMRPGRGTEQGVDAISISVVTRDRVTHTAEEYRAILQVAQAVP